MREQADFAREDFKKTYPFGISEGILELLKYKEMEMLLSIFQGNESTNKAMEILLLK